MLKPFCSSTYYYSVVLPKTLGVNQTANLVLETVQTHATTPLPAQAAQNDPQSLIYDAGLFVLSPYNTLVQRTKVRYVLTRPTHEIPTHNP